MALNGNTKPGGARRLATAIAVAATVVASLAHAQSERRTAPGLDPAPMAHVVQPGDTLIALAARYLAQPSAWPQLAELNRVSDPRQLVVGSTLRIPATLLRPAAKAEVRIAAFQGQVVVTEAGRSGAPRLGGLLNEGSVIETGPNAYARLALADGGAISVPSNTRLRVDRARAVGPDGALDQSFTVLQGRIESRVSRVRDGGGYSVRTPVSVSAVRGTVFRSTYDADRSRATAEVLEGAVDVESGGASERVPSGAGAVADSSGLRVARLPAAPYLAQPDLPQSGRRVTFEITPLPGATAYRAVLAADPALDAVIAEAESLPGEARVVFPDLPDGFHVVAISAVSADGLEGPRSIYDFLRARNELRDLSAAPVLVGAVGRAHLFRWASDGDATPRYRFQLHRLGDAAPVVDREGVKETQIQVADLKPGAYEWRVRVSRTIAGQLVDSWSPPQALTVRR